MGDHYGTDTGVNSFAKRHKLGFVQAFARVIDDRQAAMRIDGGVAVAGEMLSGGDHLLALHAFSKCDSKACDIVCVFAKASDINNGICGIVVDIQNRCINMLNADRTGLAAGDNTHPAGEFGISGSGNGHCPWKIRCVFEPHSDTCFSVERHQKRNVGRLLHSVGKMRRFINRSAEENNAADLVFDDIAL